MRSSSVRIEAGNTVGSGFFASPRHVLTCFHVVRSLAVGDTAEIFYAGKSYNGKLLRKLDDQFADKPRYPYPDLAVLDLEQDIGEPVQFDCLLPERGARVRAYGFPIKSDHGGEEATAIYEDQVFLRAYPHPDFRLVVKNAQVGRGMSGAAVYLTPDSDLRVIGLLTATNDANRQQGGLVTPAVVIVEAIKDIVPLRLYQPPAAAPTPTSAASEHAEPVDEAAVAATLQAIDAAETARRRGRYITSLGLAREALELAPHNGPASLRARAMRAVALILSEMHELPDEAKALADFAAALDADPIATIRIDAAIARSDRGPEAALASIPQDLSPELESLRAGYFLELGDEPSARAILNRLPPSEAEKPRVKRVRLAASFTGKRRDEALRLAESLVAAASEDVIIAYAVAQIFVYGSVPTEFWPGNFVVWPQPVPESETISDPEQPTRLREATRLSELLLSNDELDDISRGIVETLKLASLLYDPTRRAEARAYAMELLSV